MIVRRFIYRGAFALLARGLGYGVFIGWNLLCPLSSQGHAPFDSNARITIRSDRIEATVTAGTGLAKEILKDTGIDPTRGSGVGPAKLLPLEVSPRVFALDVAGKSIEAQSVRGMTDGLEALLVVTFSRPAGGPAKLTANYAAHLPASAVSALLVTDEQGTMLGSHIVSDGSKTAEFHLPSPVTSPAVVQTESTPPEAPANASIDIAAASTTTPVVRTPSFLEYLKLGIHHIVTGYDHLLFLCGLLVGCKRIRPMLAIITCFTLAHSVTLGLAALNFISLSSKFVEPIIAASIIFVGLENFRRGDNVKARCWLAVGFGLIHGFGFAGALRETGLGSSPGSLVAALCSFNLGVELGQLVIATIFLGLLWQLRKLKPVEQYATPVISVVVIGLGGWWLVQRTFLS